MDYTAFSSKKKARRDAGRLVVRRIPDANAAGVQVTLEAVALSVKPGAVIESVTIGGALRTEGADVVTFEVADGGTIAFLQLSGGIEALDSGSRATQIDGSVPSLDGVAVAEPWPRKALRLWAPTAGALSYSR